MRDVIEQWRWWRNGIVWRMWVDIGLLVVFSLLKDIDGVLQLCEPCSLLVDVLLSSFSKLSDCLVPHDGFLFLLEPFYFLLDPD
jgi:hypothetical protein